AKRLRRFQVMGRVNRWIRDYLSGWQLDSLYDRHDSFKKVLDLTLKLNLAAGKACCPTTAWRRSAPGPRLVG
ncbi:MAG: hypothetical protein ACRDH2_08785, partial [Anaerolineales bacterium]